ncbi:hypothetical protein EYR38_002048 [Pleurotus pulmonarius]|nr:hypothetical protein EYR38_002048 [Pleurotus pulmonarius]
MSKAELSGLQVNVARSLLPILSFEFEHITRAVQDQIILRKKPHGSKLLCAQSCVDGPFVLLDTSASTAALSFAPRAPQRAESVAREILSATMAEDARAPEAKGEYEALRIACLEGTPLMSKSPIPHILQGWTLKFLSDLFGKSPCVLEDCETSERHQSTIQQFLSDTFLSEDKPLKLKDYPLDAAFASAFPTLCRSFQFALPCPAVTSFEGPFNVTNFYPSNYLIRPDLGPKAYIATQNKTIQSRCHGTTRLHMDLSDAVNIMLPITDNSAALWHIFAASDADKLREFLQKKYPGQKTDHIHSQQTYLTQDDLTILEEQFSIRPFTFIQRGNDAVIIPTGCPHQVLNLAPCANIAVDFLSQQSISRCGDISEQLRKTDINLPSNERRQDVLEFKNLLLHAWFGLQKVRPTPEPINPHPRHTEIKDAKMVVGGEASKQGMGLVAESMLFIRPPLDEMAVDGNVTAQTPHPRRGHPSSIPKLC